MSVANFKPTIWAATILDNYNDRAVYKSLVNTDYEGEIKGVGDTVKIHSIGRVTVSTYTANSTSITPEELDGASQNLTITQADYFAFKVDDVDAAQIKANVMGAGMKEAAWGMADTADAWLAGIIDAGVATANTVDAVTVGGSDTDAYRVLVRMQRLLNDANTPKSGRWVAAPNWFLEELLLDPRFVSFGTSENRNTAMSGMIESLLGFRLEFTNNAPVTGSQYSLLGGCKEAVTFADSIPEGSPEAYRPQSSFSDAVKGLHVYGAKVTRPNNLVKVPITQTTEMA